MPKRKRKEGIWMNSPAKINLGLRVLGIRPDGYHEVETWIQQVSLFDRIWVLPVGRSIRITANREDIPQGRKNIVYRAAAALRAEVGESSLGAKIHLVKHIPRAAGLGGGSGNAALVLLALNRLWECGLKISHLREIASSVGSDVPAFLGGAAALCRGRGERVLSSRGLRAGWIVLAKPPYSLDTSVVYGWMRVKLKTAGGRFKMGKMASRQSDPNWQNDLEEVVFHRRPGLAKRRDLLLSLGARQALMSGSGPALFGLFKRRADAEKAAMRFRGFRRWSVYLVRPLFRPALKSVFSGKETEAPGEIPNCRF